MKTMIRLVFPLVIFIYLSVVYANAQSKRLSPSDYISNYKSAAIAEMKRSGIPASITLAQGMLESENGNSTLAREGNNHFGIKCHDWTGQKMYKDDDSKNECFRKYKSADESYRDHSDFLLGKQRYSLLFEYKTSDYKNWAKGLKKTGYATNPRYDDMLIRLIEENKLYEFDQDYVSPKRNLTAQNQKRQTGTAGPEFSFSLTRPVFKRNNIEYIVVKNGDSFDKISREMEMLSWELLKYNELTKESVLREGQILYLQPKRRKAERGQEIHTVVQGENVYTISQLFGVKSSRIRRINNLSDTAEVKIGDVIKLR